VVELQEWSKALRMIAMCDIFSMRKIDGIAFCLEDLQKSNEDGGSET
jgi:hypothetical protein